MPPTHPLALLLAARLHSGARVLYVGDERSRNVAALTEYGLAVETLPDREKSSSARGPYDAAISTHALLHGTIAEVTATLCAIAAVLPFDAPFLATFGNRADARFGSGTRIAERTYAQVTGDEVGVAHSFFDESELRELLEPAFEVESIESESVDAIAGTWAHSDRPLEGAVHWFVVARRGARQ